MTTRILGIILLAAVLSAIPLRAQTPAAPTAPAPAQPPATPATPATPAPAAAVAADEPTGAPLDVNLRSVDFGVRISDVSGDEARFNRYVDHRTGPVVQAFRWTSENASRYWRTEADNVGYRDQRFSGEFEQFGKFKGWFQYNQIPYEQDYSTRTPFNEQSPTVLTIDDALQTGIQNGTSTLTNSVDSFSRPFELRSRRDITTFGGQYQASTDLDLNFAFTSTGRTGHQPFAGSFGFTSQNEIPAPIDSRNNEIDASVEWSNRTALLRAEYDGSFFDTDTESIAFDNPIRFNDIATAPGAGRTGRFAASTMHTLSATASTALPARSRVVAYLARSGMTSDADLLPWTINSAIPAPPMPRTTVDGDIDVTTVMLRFTSRPLRWTWFNASFRRYDLENHTPLFQYDQKVNYDSSLVSSPGEHAHQFSYDRNTIELDGSFTPWRFGALRIGYVKEDVDRTDRIYDTTTEDSVRFSYDWTNNPFVTARASYSHSKRRGHGFHPEILEHYEEQPGLRHADISDRDRDVAQFIVTALPTSTLSINFTGSVGNDDRPGVEFGLQSQDFSTVGFGFDYSPSDAVSLGMNYTYETFASLEASRSANPPPDPTFSDARRNWNDDIDENVDTVSAYVEVPKIAGKVDVAFNYDYTKADTSWRYGVPSDSTLTAPVQLPNAGNSWAQARLVANYWWRRNLSFGVTYLYDRFKVTDWGLGNQTLDRLAFSNSFLLMPYGWDPYTAHTVWLKATYLW